MKILQPSMFVIVHWAPGLSTDPLSKFSDFLSALVLKTYKVNIVGDINIDIDVENNSLGIAFLS